MKPSDNITARSLLSLLAMFLAFAAIACTPKEPVGDDPTAAPKLHATGPKDLATSDGVPMPFTQQPWQGVGVIDKPEQANVIYEVDLGTVALRSDWVENFMLVATRNRGDGSRSYRLRWGAISPSDQPHRIHSAMTDDGIELEVQAVEAPAKVDGREAWFRAADVMLTEKIMRQSAEEGITVIFTPTQSPESWRNERWYREIDAETVRSLLASIDGQGI